MPQDRPEIPEPIKREVRQRCGFGCVVCGMQNYQYDHMLGWAETQRHVASEITLLCPTHHAEKTSGLLTLDQVQRADQDPHNRKTGVTAPLPLHFEGSEAAEVFIGNNVFQWTGPFMHALIVDGDTLVGFFREDEQLYFHLVLKDELNNVILAVVKNELVVNAAAWDIELVARRLKIRSGPGDIFLDVNFEPPRRVAIERARILSNGVDIRVSGNNGLVIDGALIHITANVYMRSYGIIVGQSEFGRGYGVNRYRRAETSGRDLGS